MVFPAAELDSRLLAVMRANPEKTAAWLREEPGSWGFLAGQAVRAVRQETGRPLTDPERRYVWHRLWQLLSQLRESMESMDG